MRVPRSALLPALLALAGACSDGGKSAPDSGAIEVDAGPPPDARRFQDAGPPCVGLTDTECEFTSSEVVPADITLEDQLALARRFNPAQVITGAHSWPVSVDYLLSENRVGLQRAMHRGRAGSSYDVDETSAFVVTPQPDLLGENWSSLPVEGLVYFVDTEGESTGSGYDDETWTAAWIAAQGGNDDDALAATYVPTQYAHLFWLSRDNDLLAIQYWFFYPYRKWVDSHEGNWQHVNIVLRYYPGGAPELAFGHFSMGEAQAGVPLEELIRVADQDGGNGDHVTVFTGGDACADLIPDTYCGRSSGASMPYPGTYMTSALETVAGGTSRVGRAIHANDFEVVLLPRVVDVDFDASPNLSWYNMPMLFGQPTVAANDDATLAAHGHRAPLGPGPEHDEYDVGVTVLYDIGALATPEAMVVPAGWTMIADPSQDF